MVSHIRAVAQVIEIHDNRTDPNYFAYQLERKKASRHLIWAIWVYGLMARVESLKVLGLLVTLYLMGEGEPPRGRTEQEIELILYKSFVKAVTRIGRRPHSLPSNLPKYCTYEMLGRILFSHLSRTGDTFPFPNLDWKEELRQMDLCGDNVLDAKEIELIKPIVALPPQDKLVAYEVLAERYPHRRKAVWESLGNAWYKVNRARFKRITILNIKDQRVSNFIPHFESRFPWVYKRKPVYSPIHDRIVAAEYYSKLRLTKGDVSLGTLIHNQFRHRTAQHWDDLIKVVSASLLHDVELGNIYDDYVWLSYYHYLGNQDAESFQAQVLASQKRDLARTRARAKKSAREKAELKEPIPETPQTSQD